MSVQVLLEHRDDVKLESIVVSALWLTVFERSNGLRSATVYKLPEVDSAYPWLCWTVCSTPPMNILHKSAVTSV